MTAACEAGKLKFTWDAALRNNASTEDRVMAVAYNPTTEEAVYTGQVEIITV